MEGHPPHNEKSVKCIEDYIVRIEKEGLGYHVLKAHADEKLKLAKKAITQAPEGLGLGRQPGEGAGAHPLAGEDP